MPDLPLRPRWRKPGPEGLRGVVASLADGIIVVDGEGRIRFANPAACELFGRPLGQLAGADFGFPVHAGEVTEIELLVAGIPPRVVEMRTAAGRWNGGPAAVVALRDVTAKARALAEIEQLGRQALYDPLTGLANRTLLLDRLRQALARSARTRGSLAVMFIDLDNFKSVNDRLGHDVGDKILRTVAERVQLGVRPADTVCRLGGDEFVVVCEGVDGLVEATEIATRVETAVAQPPCTIDGNEVTITASVGLVVAGGGNDSPERLLSDADAAMYLAKKEGKARHYVFDQAVRAQADERTVLAAGLHDAIEAGRLSLVYQPVVTLATGTLSGLEALLRYDDPTHGVVSADSFIDTAEDSGLIVPLGTWALEQACRDAASWRRRWSHLPVTVNLGLAQMAQTALVAAVHAALDDAGLAPEGLTLDLAETAVARASGDIFAGLSALSDAGVRLGIDDWGHDTASLSALTRLPLSYVKLDRSVVAGLKADPRPAAALAAAARAVGLASIAEGVESADQHLLLLDMGCTAGQGSHLAPPVAPEAVADTLAADRLQDSWEG